MIYTKLILIHIILGIGITYLVNAVISRYDGFHNIGVPRIVGVFILTSLLSITLTIGLSFLPPLNRLPGAMFEGGLMVTLPIMIVVFTIIFICVNVYLVEKVSRKRFLANTELSPAPIDE